MAYMALLACTDNIKESVALRVAYERKGAK